MEGQVDDLKQKVDELTAELKMAKSQLVQARVQQEALVSALRSERTLRKKRSTESSRNSAEIDELMEKSEKMANVNDLKGKICGLLPRHRSNSKGKMAALNGSETAENGALWTGGIEIAEHSTGADRMSSSKLVRRLSQEKHNPQTSTPVSTSGRDSPHYLDESLGVTQKEIKESHDVKEKTENLNSDATLVKEQDTSQVENHHRGDLRIVSSREPRKNSNKRDSGISVDASPIPST